MPGISFKLVGFLFAALPLWILDADTFAKTDPHQPVNIEGAHNISVSGRSIRSGNVPAITLTNCYNAVSYTHLTLPTIYSV